VKPFLECRSTTEAHWGLHRPLVGFAVSIQRAVVWWRECPLWRLGPLASTQPFESAFGTSPAFEILRVKANDSYSLGEKLHLKSKEPAMNWEQIEGAWKEVKGNVKSQWGKLTDDDLKTIDGKREKLAGVLQQRYGKVKDAVETEIDEFVKNMHGT
jgi:uncharacterized protein YjbJ (UPF0337 family)